MNSNEYQQQQKRLGEIARQHKRRKFRNGRLNIAAFLVIVFIVLVSIAAMQKGTTAIKSVVTDGFDWYKDTVSSDTHANTPVVTITPIPSTSSRTPTPTPLRLLTPTLQSAPPIIPIPTKTRLTIRQFISVPVIFHEQPVLGASWVPIVLENNPKGESPTWDALVEFLIQDPTNLEQSHPLIFNTFDAAVRLHNNAELSGIKAGYMIVQLIPSLDAKLPVQHAVVVFATVDRGVIYVDPLSPRRMVTVDRMVSLEVGADYILTSIPSESAKLRRWDSMGLIWTISEVIW